MSTGLHPRLDRNVRRYTWYAAAFNAYFWLPVFFLYFSAHVPLRDVLRLEAIYYAGVVALEVPSGYFSDAVGRRVTLLASSAALVVAYGLFFFGSSFAFFAAAQLCLAVGLAFNSGTDTSFHYDSLAALGREREFAAREARVARVSFLAGAVAALAGGAAGAFELRLAYGLSLLAAAALFVLVLSFVEPSAGEEGRSGQGAVAVAASFLPQLRRCVGHLRQPALLWLFVFAVLMTVLNHVPYELYQPYLDLLARNLELSASATPLAAGAHTALTMLAGSWVAGRSILIRDRLGIASTLLLSTLLQALIIGVMGLVLHPAVTLLILLRSTPRALMTAPLNAAIAPRVERAHRATYFSLQSLAGRLSFSATLALLSLAVHPGAAPAWPAVSAMLRTMAVVALLALAGLAATAPRISRSPK